MSMMKDRNLAVRVPGELFDAAQQTAADYGTTASQVARLLLDAWVRAARTHPGSLVWPPQFVIHTVATQPAGPAATLTYARAERIPALVADRPGTSHAKPRG